VQGIDAVKALRWRCLNGGGLRRGLHASMVGETSPCSAGTIGRTSTVLTAEGDELRTSLPVRAGADRVLAGAVTRRSQIRPTGVGGVNVVGIDPPLHLGGFEADEVPYLQEGDPAFEHEASNEPFGDGKAGGHASDVKEGVRRSVAGLTRIACHTDQRTRHRPGG
jgi:hypothetical protein